tara:strand:+ start:320 stop:997 length:678 start_codon:yes stop_codon:yes gene_type:complete
MSNTIKNYNNLYQNIDNKVFPQEWVVRIFMGKYPKLDLRDNLEGKKILEVSCGDGRNLAPLIKKNMKISATEITNQVVKNLANAFPNIEFKQALNSFLPFDENNFDYLLSWNQIYYMGIDKMNLNFTKYVEEFSRVLKPGGKLIVSVPMVDSFIFKDSIEINRNYRMVSNDPFDTRNGEVLRCFKGEQDIVREFSKYFNNFTFASSINDHFGIQNNWHIFVCQKI